MYTTEQAAVRLGVARRTVQKWIEAGKLEATKVGRDYIITEATLQTFVPPDMTPGPKTGSLIVTITATRTTDYTTPTAPAGEVRYELRRNGGNPWPRYFTQAALDAGYSLGDLWHLTSHSYAVRRSSWEYPFDAKHLPLMEENRQMLADGKTADDLWRYRSFNPTGRTFLNGICKRVDEHYYVFSDGEVRRV